MAEATRNGTTAERLLEKAHLLRSFSVAFATVTTDVGQRCVTIAVLATLGERDNVIA